MIRKSIYKLEDILPLIEPGKKVNLDGDIINIGSLRLVNFKEHGIVCVTCGLTGSFFAKEKTKKDKTYHLNLYAVKDNIEILMTQDHIVPVSLGGKSFLGNVQTMCTKCNVEKGNGQQKQISKIEDSSLMSFDKDMRRTIQYLRSQIEKKTITVDDLNILVRDLNKMICSTISTNKLKEVQEGIDIKEFDSRQTDFVNIGNNVVVAHCSKPDENCKNFYIFNKVSRERLHIHMK
jgi:hypothetical protein